MTRVPAGASEAAVACSLSQADLKRRQQRWLLLAERAHIDTVLTGNGLRLSFRADPMNERELEELTALEQDCCAFANWFLHSRGDELVLDVSAGGAEGIAAVQAMFRGWARHHRKASQP
jgi:hypothetical protein